MSSTRTLVSVLAAMLLAPHISWAGTTSTVNATAAVLSKSVCHFNTTTATLSFGNLDPSAPADTLVSTTLPLTCHGNAPLATFNISSDSGLHETGPNANRMRHASSPGAFLPYTLTITPSADTVAKNVQQIVTISAIVHGSDYQTAIPGDYTDRITLSILP